MTKFYKREIGEGDWMACSYEEYLRCQSLPEMDSKYETTPDDDRPGANMYTINDFEQTVREVQEGVGNEAFDVKNSIGNLFGGIKNYFQTKLLGLDKPLLTCDIGAAKRVAGKLNYTDVMDQMIFQPQRMNCSYQELLPLLDQGARYLSAVEQAMPSVLNSLVAILNRQGVSVYSTAAITAAKNKMELDLQKKFNGRDSAEAVFSTRFESMTQYTATYVEFNSLVQGLIRRNPKEVRLNVDRVAELAEMIHTNVTEGELDLTGAQVKHIGELLLQMARVVDTYSVVTTILLGTQAALDNTADKLLRKK